MLIRIIAFLFIFIMSANVVVSVVNQLCIHDMYELSELSDYDGDEAGKIGKIKEPLMQNEHSFILANAASALSLTTILISTTRRMTAQSSVACLDLPPEV